MTDNEVTTVLLILTMFTIYAYYHVRPKKDFSGLDRDEAARWIARITFFVVSFALIIANIIINLRRLHD